MANDRKEAKGIIQTYKHEQEIMWKQGDTGEKGDIENPMAPQAHTPPAAQQVPTEPATQAIAPAATR